MAARVAIYEIPSNKRSKMIAQAMRDGLNSNGISANIIPTNYYRKPEGQIAVFYGFDSNLQRIFKDYRDADRTVVYVDLGYWGRRDGGSLHGYHKIAVNSRHPTDYFQSVRHDDSRVKKLGLKVEPWRSGGKYILLAGMSAKSAQAEGFAPNEWERRAIAELAQHTDRPIIYRPKPSWGEARPLPGAGYASDISGLPALLANCHAVVTHHSNVAIDGLLAGVPAFCTSGVASVMSLSNLARIEKPWRPDGREAFVNDLSYCQFSVAEIRSGEAWRHLMDEGLVE